MSWIIAAFIALFIPLLAAVLVLLSLLGQRRADRAADALMRRAAERSGLTRRRQDWVDLLDLDNVRRPR